VATAIHLWLAVAEKVIAKMHGSKEVRGDKNLCGVYRAAEGNCKLNCNFFNQHPPSLTKSGLIEIGYNAL
jgi:hypothetical protein